MAAFDPDAKAAAMRTKYMVSTTGDRWFIPYNDAGSTADQLAQCKKAVGSTADDSDAGAETVA